MVHEGTPLKRNQQQHVTIIPVDPKSDDDSKTKSSLDQDSGILFAEVQSHHSKNHRIIFDRSRNIFEFRLLDDSEKHFVVYRLDELLCTTKHAVKIRRGRPIILQKVTETEKTLFFNFVYKKNQYKWRLKSIPVVFHSQYERDFWHTIIDSTLTKKNSELSNRPKNIIVFINPFGGKGKAEKIFKDNVEAFFKLTPGLHYEVFMTQRANHARDHIVEMPALQWEALDGLVSVGGDGLFNELLSGGLKRANLDGNRDMDDPNRGLITPHIRFGIIGAGSANSIVSTVHETNDHATSAVHIAIGSECNVDVCTVHQDRKLIRISANAISYGWLGDVLRDSENYRCLGPVRYQWSALRTTIRHPIYRGKVQFSLSHKENNDPLERTPACAEPCPICGEQKSSDSQYDYHWHAEFTHVICCVIPTVTPFTPYGLAPFTGIGDGTLDLAMVPRISRWHNMQFMRKVAMYGGKRLDREDPDLICYRVVKWSYQPDEDQEDPGVWNLDGEILEQPKGKPLHFKLHPQLISFFGRDAAMVKPTKRSFIKKRKSSIVYH